MFALVLPSSIAQPPGHELLCHACVPAPRTPPLSYLLTSRVSAGTLVGVGIGVALTAAVAAIRARRSKAAPKPHLPVFPDADRVAVFCGASFPADSKTGRGVWVESARIGP